MGSHGSGERGGKKSSVDKAWIGFCLVYLLLVVPAVCYWFTPDFQPLKHEFDWFLGAFSSSNPTTELVRVYSGKFFSGILLIVIGFFYLRMFVDAKMTWERLSWKQLSIRIFFPAVLATAAIPWVSPDVFYYLAKGKIESGYHQNAYRVSLNQVDPEERDPLIQNVIKGFRDSVGNYGPLFQKISAWASAFGKGQPRASLFYFKLICLTSYLLICVVLYQLARILDLPPKTTVAIYALNPVVLLTILVGAHNDGVMVLCTLLGVWMVLKNHSIAAGFFMGMGFAIKYVPLMLLPAVIFYWVLREENWRNRVNKTASFIISFVTVIFLSYCLYPEALGSFILLAQSGISIVRSSLTQVLGVLCFFLGADRFNVKIGVQFLFFAVYIYYWFHALKFWRNDPDKFFVLSLLWTYTLYLLICSSLVAEWYLTWIIPFAILSGKQGKLFALKIPMFFLPLVIFTIKTSRQEIAQIGQYFIFVEVVYLYLVPQLYAKKDVE